MAVMRDPVCGMSIDEDDAVETIAYGSTTYYFCSTDCGDAFRHDPDSHAAPGPSPAL